MGRIKTTAMKRLAKQMIKENEDSFGVDFPKNKLKLQEKAPIKSKKIRNMVAGYITRLIKRAAVVKAGEKQPASTEPQEVQEEE